MTRLVLHKAAIAEGRAAKEWYEARSSLAADAFLAELDLAIASIAEIPEAWPPYIEGTRRYLLRRFPFSIVYRKRPRSIQVLAIAHSSRKPGYWKDRTKV